MACMCWTTCHSSLRRRASVLLSTGPYGTGTKQFSENFLLFDFNSCVAHVTFMFHFHNLAIQLGGVGVFCRCKLGIFKSNFL